MPRRTTGNLLPLDPEIEKTCRQNKKQVKLGKQPTTTTGPSLTQGGQASSPVVPTPPTPPPPPRDIEPVIMADEAWERYKGLLMRCRSHGLEDWNVIIIFFNGIRREFRDALNNASRNGFTSMEAPAAYDLVEKIC
ncbi:unnamed protein product [Linum trigynum]|uniref:Uncharacterized protein n=1 Tax=Linum trigynum TaxID=586398 RepID=A0AAV2DWP7_9ROSI